MLALILILLHWNTSAYATDVSGRFRFEGEQFLGSQVEPIPQKESDLLIETE